VKKEIITGHPVVSTVFSNEFLIEGKKDSMAGSDEYDHIVPVLGVAAASAIDYNNSDQIIFSDNGIWGEPPIYMFTYSFGTFPKDRKAANNPKGSVYSLANIGTNYGTSISGVVDLNGDTIPVRLTASVNEETPEMEDG